MKVGVGRRLAWAWLALVGVAGALAPLVSFTGFSPVEQHVELRLQPPGTSALPSSPQLDGDTAHFQHLDRDRDGAIHGAAELLVLYWVDRFARLVMADHDSDRDGRIVRAEWPRDFQALSTGLRDELRAATADPESLWRALTPRVGAAGFEAWDTNGDGAIARDELLEASRPFRPFESDEALARLDADGDGRIVVAEYPGAPEARRFLLGSDALGRDLLTRLCHGAGISLAVALLATLVSVLIGALWGTTAALAGGRVDALMMRLVDVLYGLPFVFVVILLVMAFGRSVFNLFLALGAVQWLTMSRIVRAHVRGLLERDFIRAAVVMGLPPWRIAATHLLPHVARPALAYAGLMVPAVVVEEAFLSFLGLGVQPPQASWGTLLTDGVAVMSTHPWLAVWPAAALSVTLLALHAGLSRPQGSRG